jgi:hypothetical protein
MHNHIPLAIALISSIQLFRGSRGLGKITRQRIWNGRSSIIAGVVAVVGFGFFTWNFYMIQPSLTIAGQVSRFVVSKPILLFTYVLPHIALWSLGLLACINLAYYASRVKGVVYRSLLGDLYHGILIVFICIFLAQYLIMTTPSLKGFSWRVLLIYLELLLTTYGFMLIRRGAQKLSMIETTAQ